MTRVIGFVGDVHGSTDQLRCLVRAAGPLVDRLVFLGDYVNRGPDSAGTVEFLVQLEGSDTPCTFLEGNHDAAFRDFLSNGDLAPFLAIGGARTILSYVGAAHADVCHQTREAVPSAHYDFLSRLEATFEIPGLLVASHRPVDSASGGFRVHGHVTQASGVPLVTDSMALIDTGCGTIPGAPLTCFLWPEKSWLQFN